MAQMASGNDGSRTYSYTRTETYTFEEAIQKAINGSLDPSEIYRQGQVQLKKFIDSLAMKEFTKQFSELSNSQQRELLKKLLSEIEKEKEQSKQPLTMLDALKMAKDGIIDSLELYQGLPNELREVLDTISMSYNVTNFNDANPELRKEILGFIIDMLSKNIEEDSKRGSLAKTDQHTRNEAKLLNKLEVEPRNAKQCIVCGKPLGFLDKVRKKEKHSKCK